MVTDQHYNHGYYINVSTCRGHQENWHLDTLIKTFNYDRNKFWMQKTSTLNKTKQFYAILDQLKSLRKGIIISKASTW